MLTPNLDFIDHITNEGLEGRSATGVCMGSSGDSLLAINWRTKTVTEMTMEGQTIGNDKWEHLVFLYFKHENLLLVLLNVCLSSLRLIL